MFKFTAIVMFTSVFFLSGCAVGRSTLELSPPLSNSSSPSNGKEIYINSVTDKRLFENSPKEPSIPSLDDSEEGGPQYPAESCCT